MVFGVCATRVNCEYLERFLKWNRDNSREGILPSKQGTLIVDLSEGVLQRI